MPGMYASPRIPSFDLIATPSPRYTTPTECRPIYAVYSVGKANPPSLMASRALVLGQHPPPTSPPSLRLRTPSLLGPLVSREATPPLDHMDSLRFEMLPTKGHCARPYSEATLPGRIQRAKAHLRAITNFLTPNTADLGLVRFYPDSVWPFVHIVPRPSLPNPFSK